MNIKVDHKDYAEAAIVVDTQSNKAWIEWRKKGERKKQVVEVPADLLLTAIKAEGRRMVSDGLNKFLDALEQPS